MKPIYIKYNRTRKEEYQTKTVILKQDDGSLVVQKTALYENGKEHIKNMLDNYNKLKDGNVFYLKPQLSDDGFTATYEYVEGESLTHKLISDIARGGDELSTVKAAIDRILDNEKTTNIDAIFDNFIVNADKLIGIDYEWVYDGDFRDFATYRILHDFYNKAKDMLKEPNEDEFLELFGIDKIKKDAYIKEEKEFQEGIHADNQIIYLDNYRVAQRTAGQMRELEKEYKLLKEREERISSQFKRTEKQIKKMIEVKRLTDNHIDNLDIMIKNLRHENEELAKAFNYYSSHASLPTRVKRKLSTIYNKAYPKGSIKRKNLDYKRYAIIHPIKYCHMIFSEEGRNLIDGDYKIGDIYKQYGRLKVPYFEKPEVSIIIPAYNQVGYTYACVQSVIEFTKDIAYEIILADDVSTDATKDIGNYIEGLVVCRNATNQGFLRNCNNAAKSARGSYIMFLNNDTRVTENYLSSLLRLIKSDPSIGMVGSKLVYPDGKLQEAGGIIWSDGSGWNYGRNDDPDKCEYNYVRDVDYISGASILLSTELWNKIGGFDDRYAPAYCEDSDLAFEVRKAGKRVVYQPQSVVIHYEGVSNGTDTHGSGLKKYQIENSKKLKDKWADELKEQFDHDDNPNPFRARERSKGKKIVLIVDHYVPTFDKDAGSKTTYQYIRLLLNKGYEVKFLGDNFLHEEPYTSTLEQLGVEVLYGKDMQVNIMNWIEEHASDLHLVYLNRPHIASKYIDFIKDRTNIKIIYYGHDLHFLREDREFRLTGDPQNKEDSEYWKSVELSVMYKSDMNYYPSYIEKEYVQSIDNTIPIKAITAYVYDSFEKVEYKPENREGLLFVGGFSHKPNADAVLWFVNNIWENIYDKLHCNFYIVGSHAPEEITSLNNPDKGIIVKGFVSDEELKELYKSTRIVVVPLRYGAGVKGKVIEALYYSSVVVTNSIGAEGIEDAASVMAIEDEGKAMADKIVELYNDKEKLIDMSKAAFEYIKKHNSIDAAWDIIKDDFE